MLPGQHRTRTAVKARAVRELRAALTGQGRIDAALRACCYRSPIFFAGLFHESMTERFGEACDIRQITAFVARIRDARGPEAAGFPSREAEALIRAMLGDALMSEQLDPHAVSYPEIAIAVMIRLLAEWQPSTGEVTALMARSEAFATERGRQPLLAEQEDLWFAAGMPDSPFAALDESTGDSEAEL